jgi:hypothetical protein
MPRAVCSSDTDSAQPRARRCARSGAGVWRLNQAGPTAQAKPAAPSEPPALSEPPASYFIVHM